MKKFNAIMLLATLGFTAQVVAQIPDRLPFGKPAILEALTQIDSLEYKIFTRGEAGAIDVIGSGEMDLDPFSTTSQMAQQIEEGVEFEFDVDPRRNIHIDVVLFSAAGEALFTSRTSFYLEVERDSNGNPTYSLPEYAKYLYFSFEGVRIDISGVDSATALAIGETWDLAVSDDGIWIPGYLARSNSYNNLEIVFDSGQVVYYDWLGLRVENDSFDFEANHVSFNEITKIPIVGGEVIDTGLNSYNGWSQVIEINNSVDQEIQFQFRSYEGYQVPTHLLFYTVDGYNAGDPPVVHQYSEQGWEYGNYSKSIDLPAGDYFIILEWNDDLKISDSYSGEKG